MSLMYEKTSVWSKISESELKEIMVLGESYKEFLDKGKTERRAVEFIEKRAVEQGFIKLETALANGKLNAGDKVYYTYKNKAAVMMIVGTEPMEKGLHIVGSHIDCPRLDLKQRPLYEEGGMALLKTHYYGGVKKYQWTTIPLALHGVIFTKEGKKVDVCIGEDEADPVLYINDLLIHLSADQMQKKLSEGITGEQLNIVVGNSDFGSEEGEKDPIKKKIMQILFDRYGIEEDDFAVAELEAVPADKARCVGLDRSMIAAYGHDDRSCAYASLEAICEVENPKKTAVALFVDKEEIGSNGNTGMTSMFFENMLAEVLLLEEGPVDLAVRRTLGNSQILSADVSATFDPTFPEVSEKLNANILGCGVSVSKYTGSRGKYSCNDANAEFLAEVRAIFEEENVIWQTGEMGKVDQGGGGTIAEILAAYGAEVVDCGVPVISMHAPMELVSKADVYMAKKAYRAFLKTSRAGAKF
ncbi:MAG: aminopeptidase [Tissierellia bacterium]|nr:aminopeptidase [Tissierellia bacterium]